MRGLQEGTSSYRGFALLQDQVRRADTISLQNITTRQTRNSESGTKTILKRPWLRQVQVAALSLAWRKDAAAEAIQSRKFSKHPPSRRTELYLLICGNPVWGCLTTNVIPPVRYVGPNGWAEASACS